MSNNKQTKSIILYASCKLLLYKDYKDITIANLENETHLTRGAIFHHFENKKQIFIETIRYYYLKYFYEYDVSYISEQTSVDGFLSLYICPFERIITNLSNLFVIVNPEKAFCHFTIQSSMIYSKFDEELIFLLDREQNDIKNLLSMSLIDDLFNSNEIEDLIKKIYLESYSQIFQSAFLRL